MMMMKPSSPRGRRSSSSNSSSAVFRCYFALFLFVALVLLVEELYPGGSLAAAADDDGDNDNGDTANETPTPEPKTIPEPPPTYEADNPPWCNVFGDNPKELPCCDSVDHLSGELPESMRSNAKVSWLDNRLYVTK